MYYAQTFVTPSLNVITSREREILNLLSHEFSTKEIAKKLFISDYTVNTHRKNLMIKMRVKNTAGLIRKGFEYGFLNI